MTDMIVLAEDKGKEWASKVPHEKPAVASMKLEDMEEDRNRLSPSLNVNGHHCPTETNGHHSPERVYLQNGNESHATQTTILPPLSPSASPNLARRPTGSPASYQSPYQAGLNQRFHAARHKFQATTESDPSQTVLSVPAKELPPPAAVPSPDASPVKQMARSTVTQVLSRFTSVQQMPKLTNTNNSPFGTDYRNLAAPLSPVIGRATVAMQQGIRSPTIPRAERGNPPPIPPKKPGLAQAPSSPATTPKSSGHLSESSMSGSCGLTSSQEGVKELDMVVSSN